MIVGSLDDWLGRQVKSSVPAPAHTAPIAIPPRPSSVSTASSTEEPVPINLERRYSLLTLELARKPSLEEPSRRCSAFGLPRSTSQPAFEGRGWEHLSPIPQAKALSSPHHRAILSATHDEPAPWTADEDAVDDSVEQDPGGGAAGSCSDLLKYVLGCAEDADDSGAEARALLLSQAHPLPEAAASTSTSPSWASITAASRIAGPLGSTSLEPTHGRGCALPQSLKRLALSPQAAAGAAPAAALVPCMSSAGAGTSASQPSDMAAMGGIAPLPLWRIGNGAVAVSDSSGSANVFATANGSFPMHAHKQPPAQAAAFASFLGPRTTPKAHGPYDGTVRGGRPLRVLPHASVMTQQASVRAVWAR